MLKKSYLKLFFISLFCFTGCVSLSNKEKKLGSGILSFGIGSAIGYQLNKKYRLKNALLFGGGLGFLSLLLSSEVFNDEKTIRELENKIKSLEEDFDLRYNGNKLKYLMAGTDYLLKKDIPKELKEKIELGTWALYKLEKDQGTKSWVSVGNNKLIKGDKLFEFTNPKIKEEKNDN